MADKKLIAGNWKMNGLDADARALAAALASSQPADSQHYDMLLCPSFLHLDAVGALLDKSSIWLGAQDCSPEDQGAYTGDVSAAMLADAGCTHVIVGHSERRHGHGETDAMVKAKATAAHRHGLTPIICVGETLAQRDGNEAEDVVADQLRGSIPGSAADQTIVIAYEPVWAIGTGRTPGDQDIAAMHALIRGRVRELVPGAPDARLLYGGSVKPGNAKEILAIANVDGVLVGGASLDADGFRAIAEAAPH